MAAAIVRRLSAQPQLSADAVALTLLAPIAPALTDLSGESPNSRARARSRFILRYTSLGGVAPGDLDRSSHYILPVDFVQQYGFHCLRPWRADVPTILQFLYLHHCLSAVVDIPDILIHRAAIED